MSKIVGLQFNKPKDDKKADPKKNTQPKDDKKAE